MAYIRFLNSKKILPCRVIREREHIVSLSFPEPMEVNTSGFNVFLDSSGEIDIGGKFYHGFCTVYRNDNATAEYNGYQLSNDGSIYSPDSDIPADSFMEPSVEELEEQERQQNILSLMEEIEVRKQKLSETDYIIVKLYEYKLVEKDCEDYDLDELHARRQSLRDEINGLEQELKKLTEAGRE